MLEKTYSLDDINKLLGETKQIELYYCSKNSDCYIDDVDLDVGSDCIEVYNNDDNCRWKYKGTNFKGESYLKGELRDEPCVQIMLPNRYLMFIIGDK